MIVRHNYPSNGVGDDDYDRFQTSSGPPPAPSQLHHQQQQQQQQQQEQQPAMSKAEQRRNNKPIMEKRRRARINHCLNELKTLILDAMKKDPARHSKLEKADILEMTVRHLQSVQRQQMTVAMATDPGVMNRFKSGFSECAGEVSRFVSRLEGVDAGVKQRLIAHLAGCVAGLQQLSFPGLGGGLLANPEDVNNNGGSATSGLRVSGGLQLIPSRLPTGELALLVPNSSQLLNGVLPFFASEDSPGLPATPKNGVLSPAGMGVSIDRSHPSAFTAVTRTRQAVSPLPSSCGPDYTSSSDDDDEDDDDDSIISDTYLSPNSPPAGRHGGCPGAAHHQDDKPQPVSHLKLSPSAGSGFKPYHQAECRKPQQQPTVTSSTCPESSPEASNLHNLPGDQFTQVRLELKTMPVSSNPLFPDLSARSADESFASLSSTPMSQTVSSSTPIQLPLSVITYNEKPQGPTGHCGEPPARHKTDKDPLDFSFGKTENSAPLQAVAWPQACEPVKKRHLTLGFDDQVSQPSPQSPPNFFYPTKIPRLALDMVSRHNAPLVSGCDTDERTATDARMQQAGEGLTPFVEETAASSSSHVNGSEDCCNRDMWRPW